MTTVIDQLAGTGDRASISSLRSMTAPSNLPPNQPARWRVRLLGSLGASDGDGAVVERFGSAAVAGLLARLALFPGRSHSREELIDLLWPEIELRTGRNRLRQTLFALRTLLEPPSTMPRPVIVADRAIVRAVPGALDCDAVEFERAVREGRHADALTLYVGELMPGRYDDWIDEARQRYAALAERAADALDAAGAAPWPPHDPAGRVTNPPAAARRDRSPLPIYLTRFFGRDDDMRRLRTALETDRLVTLTGPGGCGKTRLASAICTAWQGDATLHHVLVVLFVPLIGCSTRAAFIDALATALHLPTTTDDSLTQIVDALEARPVLAVLDNFEQLVDAAADAVGQLLAALPELRVLATSRRWLGIDGEHRFALSPLPVPTRSSSLAEAIECASVALFIDRARAVRTDFHASAGNRASLVELVRVLEGLPLAIELAASRVRSVSPAEMLSHLRPSEDGGAVSGAALALLSRSTPHRGSNARHASMLRTVEWSWQLLTPALQCFLSELTVFEGPFTATAAAAVATSGTLPLVAFMLDELVSHSLLRTTGGGDQESLAEGAPAYTLATRFELDATIRSCAAAHVTAAAGVELRQRHRRWWIERGRSLQSTPLPMLLHGELRDFGAAWVGALDDDLPGEAVALAVAWRRGLPDVAVPASWLPRLAAALAMSGAGAMASRGHTLLGRLYLAAGSRDEAARHSAAGLELARSLPAHEPGRAELLGRALHTAASIAWRSGRDAVACEALLDEAEPLAAASADDGLQASLLALRAFVANVAHQNVARAEVLHANALAVWEAAGDAVAANSGRYNLAVCALRAKRYDEVVDRLATVSREAERQHDWRLLSQARNVEGEAHAGRRDWQAAAQAYRQSLELAWNALAQPSFAFALWNLPLALARQRDPARAAALAGAAERFWETRMGDLDASDRRDVRRLERLLAAQLGAEVVHRLWRDGAALPLPEVVALALGRPAPPGPHEPRPSRSTAVTPNG